MAIDFPASPTVGDVFIVGVVTYVWDGVKWTSSATNSPFSLGSATTPSITFINDSNTGLYSPGADQVSITTGGTERFRVDAAGQLEAVNLGTAAAPAYSFTTDPNTGIYSPGADQLAISTNGVGRLFIDASGNVGVATANPSGALDVRGNALIGARDANPASIELGNGATGNRAAFVDFTGDTTYTDYGLRIERGNTGANAASTLYHRGTGNFVFNAVESSPFVFTHYLTERMRLDSSGRLGLGTSSPQALLHVNGGYAGFGYNSSGTYPSFNTYFGALGSNFSNAGSELDIWNTTGNGFAFRKLTGPSAQTCLLYISNAGNVGIGTTSPATTLDVSGPQAANVTAVAALDINCSLGNYFTKTINANSTFTVSSVPASRSYSFTLELTHTSGTVTWFTGVTWPNSTAPTLTTGKVHLFMFVTDDGGTTWRGSSLINY